MLFNSLRLEVYPYKAAFNHCLDSVAKDEQGGIALKNC